MAPKTKIHNMSAQPIFLIPIACTDGDDLRSQGRVREEKAKKIEGNDFIEVESSDYNLDRNPNAQRKQIYILFRSGDAANAKEFVTNLKKLHPDGVKLHKEEKLYLHNQLSPKRDMYLNRNIGGTVIELQDMIKDLEKRVDKIKDLEKRVEDLEAALAKLLPKAPFSSK